MKNGYKIVFKPEIIGAAIGIIVFIFIYGVEYINPQNDSWLINIGSDLSAEYIGWQFYRTSEWRFPLSLVEGVIYPDAVSTMYVGFSPVLAVLLKLLSPLLPKTFQPFGLMGLLAYALQGGMATHLCYKKTKIISVSIISSIFFTLSTVMIGKMYAQNMLAFHAIILFALILFEDREILFKGTTYKHVLMWSIAMFGATNLHMYYVPMVFCFMLFFYIDYAKREHRASKVLWFFIPTVVSFVTMWVFGIMYGDHSYWAEGFGRLNFSINGFFITGNTSFIMKLLGIKSSFRSDYEGYAYLGAGVILLIIITFFLIIKSKDYSYLKLKKTIPLLVVSLVFALAAMNPSLKINDKVIFCISWPEPLYNLFSIFRGNGRFIWPVIYIMIYCLCVYLAKKTSKRNAVIVLLICLGVQFFDMYDYIAAKTRYTEYLSRVPAVMTDDYWGGLAENGYEEIFFFVNEGELITKSYPIKTVIALSEYAYQNGMRLNDSYCARKNTDRIEEERKAEYERILNGKADSKKLYIFPKEYQINDNIDGFKTMTVDEIRIGTKK